MKKEEKQGETTIFRYQSADEILKIIQSGIGEEEAKAAHKPQKKTEEKYDAVQSDFTAPKRKIGIRDEPEESGLIGIYSPIHRVCTLFRRKNIGKSSDSLYQHGRIFGK